MIVPLLITGGILGGIYLWAPRAGTPVATGPQPSGAPVIPPDQIPTQLQTRMQNIIPQLPPQLQAQLPMSAWGDPNLWAQAAAVLNQLQPGSPQSPELMAIATALRALPVPQPQPNPGPLPPLPIPIPTGPIAVPPALQTQLNQVLAGLPAPFNAAIPSFPFPGPPSTGPLAPSIDPAVLTLLAQQIESALPGRAEPNQLRAIAAQLAATRAPAAPPALPPGPMPVMNIAPAALNGANVYEAILRNTGGAIPEDLRRSIQLAQQLGAYSNVPPIAGVPGIDARVGQGGTLNLRRARRWTRACPPGYRPGGRVGEFGCIPVGTVVGGTATGEGYALDPSAVQRRRYARALGY